MTHALRSADVPRSRSNVSSALFGQTSEIGHFPNAVRYPLWAEVGILARREVVALAQSARGAAVRRHWNSRYPVVAGRLAPGSTWRAAQLS